MSERGSGPVYIAGAVGRILRVGDREFADDATLQQRAADNEPGLYEQYESTAEFTADVNKAERQLAEDKRKLKQMAASRSYAKRRAERIVQLFQTDEDRQRRFPTPMDRWRH
jgi:hypothetical protein